MAAEKIARLASHTVSPLPSQSNHPGAGRKASPSAAAPILHSAVVKSCIKLHSSASPLERCAACLAPAGPGRPPSKQFLRRGQRSCAIIGLTHCGDSPCLTSPTVPDSPRLQKRSTFKKKKRLPQELVRQGFEALHDTQSSTRAELLQWVEHMSNSPNTCVVP